MTASRAASREFTRERVQVHAAAFSGGPGGVVGPRERVHVHAPAAGRAASREFTHERVQVHALAVSGP